MAKGYFLGFGLGSVNPKFYQGWSGTLYGTEPDVKLFSSRLKSAGYEVREVLTKKATVANFKKEFVRISKLLKPEDILVILYSGHGGSVLDTTKDEKDKYDETFCLYDGEITDDYVYEMLSLLPKCRVVMFADSCHSGSAYRLAGTKRTIKARPKSANSNVLQSSISTNSLKCSLRYFGGCQDNQTSADLGTNGLFTKCTWETIDRLSNIKLPVTWYNFYRNLYSTMPADQKPTHVREGLSNINFDTQEIFTI